MTPDSKPMEPRKWRRLNKIGFRFIFLFTSLFILFLPLRFLLDPFLAWMGRYFFNLSENLTTVSTGSGDGVMYYLSVLLQTFLAFFGTIVWSALDRKRGTYVKIQFWFVLIVRHFVAVVMFVYGFAKVFLIQFQQPSLTALMTPLGEMSPMGLAWTFMGFNPFYSVFTGLLEVAAGLLLFYRRTRTLGAILEIGIMSHVAVMNLSFDIPVKIFSIHLVLMGLIILYVDRERLAALVGLRYTPSETTNYHPLRGKKLFNYTNKIKLLFLVIILLVGGIVGTINVLNINGRESRRDAFYGIWEVTDFSSSGIGSEPWDYLIKDENGFANIKVKDSVANYHFKVDSLKNNVAIYLKNDAETKNNFRLKLLDNKTMKLNGVLATDTLSISLKRRDLRSIRLINRGFHWVNETPFK